MKDIGEGLTEEFSKVQKLLAKYQLNRYRKFGPSGDTHRGQGRVLAILKLQPEISQKDLGYLLDMRNQSLGELLGKLEKSGAIVRETSADDHRVMNIKLTESGKKLVEQAGRRQDDLSDIFDCLCEEDRGKLHEILSRLTEALEARLGYDQEPESKSGGHRHRE